MFDNTLHHICSALAARIHNFCSNNRNVCHFNFHIVVLQDNAGQMCVELVVLMPIILVVILISYNVGMYCNLCSRFDRCAREAILVQGVAPAGEQSAQHACEEIQNQLQASMDTELCDIEVQNDALHADPSRPLSYAVSPLLTRYTCTMKYKPWPSSFVCAGVAFSPQAYVEHKKSLVVDRFRAGVLV